MKKSDPGLTNLYGKIIHLRSISYITASQGHALRKMGNNLTERKKAFDIIRLIKDNGALNFKSVEVNIIPTIMTIGSSVDELRKHGFITKEEGERIKQMAWGGKEDLTVALSLTQNLFAVNNLESARLKYCTL